MMVRRCVQADLDLRAALAGRFCRAASAIGGLLFAVSLTGCGFGGTAITGGVPAATTVSNNWELATTATSAGSSTQPLTDLSGSVLEETSGSDPHRTTAVFLATAGCYAADEVVPFDGSITGSMLQVRSFGVRGQFLTLTGTLDSTASHLTGTYQIGGGCSNGEAGSFTGTRYSALTGTYAGAVTGAGTAHQVTLHLTQSTDPTGQGTFLLAGTAALTNFSCFTAGTVTAQGSSISGSKVSLLLSADGGGGATISITGNIDSAAATFSVTSFQVAGGGCAGNYGAATLQRQ